MRLFSSSVPVDISLTNSVFRTDTLLRQNGSLNQLVPGESGVAPRDRMGTGSLLGGRSGSNLGYGGQLIGGTLPRSGGTSQLSGGYGHLHGNAGGGNAGLGGASMLSNRSASYHLGYPGASSGAEFHPATGHAESERPGPRSGGWPQEGPESEPHSELSLEEGNHASGRSSGRPPKFGHPTSYLQSQLQPNHQSSMHPVPAEAAGAQSRRSRVPVGAVPMFGGATGSLFSPSSRGKPPAGGASDTASNLTDSANDYMNDRLRPQAMRSSTADRARRDLRAEEVPSPAGHPNELGAFSEESDSLADSWRTEEKVAQNRRNYRQVDRDNGSRRSDAPGSPIYANVGAARSHNDPLRLAGHAAGASPYGQD
ncbi:unnamed protein product, partial [Protopolystoma xenopodis]